MSETDCDKCRHINNCLGDCVGYEQTKGQTNEEWFCGLSTEEKAKELQLIYISGRTDEFYDKPQKTVRKFIQWLKQPHNRKDDEE